jgi:N-methylhydantoinase B/oxoprolinase/acetone carboxylase alpha subunit
VANRLGVDVGGTFTDLIFVGAKVGLLRAAVAALTAEKTRVKVPRGATLEIRTGGGGGHGPPAERDAQAVLDDVRDGYTSETFARTHYPHAFEEGR